MLHLPVILLSLLLIGHGFCVEEDNLRNALNSIASRQRQLAAASNYYVVPNKEADKEVPFEDELMYLDSPPREYDISNREPIGYPYTTRPPSKPHRYYEEDRTPDVDTEEYQKELKERLLERLMLDILETDEDTQPPPSPSRSRPQKKSFFREREFAEIPENLQNLYGNGDQEESLFLPPSPFRERAKTKPRSHTRLVKSYEADEPDEADDYLQAFNSLLEKYRDSTGQDFDADTITNEDVEGFLKFLNDKDPGGYYDYVIPDQESYAIKPASRDDSKRSSRGKRYWLGSNIQDRNNQRFLIQKRSAIDDKFTPISTTDKVNNSTTRPEVTEAPHNKTKSSPKKADSGKPDKYRVVKPAPKGQKEMPVDLRSQKPLNIKKKSVDWSNYFGVDKRQKKSDLKDQRKNDVLLDQYIQNYILQSVRNSAFNNRGNEYRYFPKRNAKFASAYPSREQQLETDEDLRTAEDLIIDNVLKYTGAHEGITDPRQIQRFRENVINELAAAYNLEKLRKELFEDTRRKKFAVADDTAQHHHSNNKRVATKKDSAESSLGLDDLKIKHNATFFNHEHVSKPSTHDYSKRRYEVETIPGNRYRCSAISRLIHKCQQISSNARDIDGTFTPLCALHQICNVCGSKEESQYCDIDYTTNVISICGDEPSCRYSARRVFIALQDVKNNVDACHPCIADFLQYLLSE